MSVQTENTSPHPSSTEVYCGTIPRAHKVTKLLSIHNTITNKMRQKKNKGSE